MVVAKAAGLQVIVDLSHIMYTQIQQGKTPLKYRWGDGVTDLYAFFAELQNRNLTHTVRAFYPVDEPERSASSTPSFPRATTWSTLPIPALLYPSFDLFPLILIRTFF